MKPKITMKMWAEDDRPREKLNLKGKHVLSDAELIAIILGSGSRDKTAVELAQEMLHSSNNNVADLARLSKEDLKRFKGMGEAKAISLIAAFELGKRRKNAESPSVKSISQSADAYHILEPFFSDLPHEEFYVIYLNQANFVQAVEKISSGGISGTVVDGKLIYKRALQLNASSIILSHNHPSGNLKPSEADKNITRRLGEFGKLIDIQVLDHLIVSDNGYFSFSDHQLL